MNAIKTLALDNVLRLHSKWLFFLSINGLNNGLNYTRTFANKNKLILAVTFALQKLR